MPEKSRQELLFPFGGLNDSEAASDQPDGTTVEAVNMRPFDPTNGRRRGAQRSGLKKLARVTAAEQINGSNRIQALVPVTYDQRLLAYKMLSMPTEVWSAITPSLGAGYAAETDSYGNVYLFDGVTSILKYNPTGTLLGSILLPSSGDDAVVPRIVFDEFNSLFVALNASYGGRVIKFSFDEERGYQQTWTITCGEFIRDFSVQNDMLIVCADWLAGEITTTGSSILAYLGTSFSSAPEFAWEKPAPGPISALSLTSSGIYYASAPNRSRIQYNDTDYRVNVVNWSPTELANIAGRMHYWLDPSHFNSEDAGHTFEDEDYINETIQNITTRTDYEAFQAFDLTLRNMNRPGNDKLRMPNDGGSSSDWYNLLRRNSPQYRTLAFSQYPALWFAGRDATFSTNNWWCEYHGTEGGAVSAENHNKGNIFASSCTQRNLGVDPYDDAKTNVEGELDYNSHAIPGHKDQKYIFAMVGRIDWSQPASAVFTAQDSGGLVGEGDALWGWNHTQNAVAFLVNVNDAGTDADQGKVTFFFRNATYSTGTNHVPFDLQAISSTGDFILVYTIDAGTGKCAVRINGRALDSFTVAQDTRAIEMAGYASADLGDGGGCAQTTGRLLLGGPATGFTLTYGDMITKMDGTGAMYQNDHLCWSHYRGQPMFTTVPYAGSFPRTAGDPDLGAEGFIGYGPLGDPIEDSYVGSPANMKGNVSFFKGHIAEVMTILSDHEGDGINNKAIDQPLTTLTDTPTPVRGQPSNSNPSGAATEVEKIEGYLAHKWGIPFVLPAAVAEESATDGLYTGHHFVDDSPTSTGTTSISGFDDPDYSRAITSGMGIVGKLAYTGDGKWAADGAGMGYGVAANEDGEVYTVGPLDSEATDPITRAAQPWVQARKIIDKGSTFSTSSADGGWVFSEPTEHTNYTLTYQYPRLALDSDGNLYWPLAAEVKSSHIRKLTGEDGTMEWAYEGLDSSQQAYGIAVPPTRPEYDDETVTSPEFLYVTADNGGSETLPQLTKLRLTSASQNTDEGFTTRKTKLLAVAGGNMVAAGKTSNTALTGGTSALASDGHYVSGTSAFQKVYMTDGLTYQVYNPKDDTVTGWVAEKSGEIPKRCKLITLWRGRMVVGRDPDDPHNWHMSATGDPNDWDQNPPTPVATQAISGNNSRAGRLADVVNAIIPYNDDLLLFGCDKKIYRLTGDPMAGGQLDLVSESTGIAFGNSWCKDPEGVIYFFGSRGGVFAMTPTGQVQNISGSKIERRLQEIELDRHRVELIWNDREQGLHVVQVPYNYKNMALTSWFWCRRHNAWFEDELTSNDKQFTAMAVMDGDKFEDRVLVFGCEDGRLRTWDEKKDDDDGDPIFSRVLIGPITDEASSQSFRFGKVQVELAGEQGGAHYDFFSSRVADKQGGPLQSGSLQAGANGVLPGKQRGGSAWVRLRSGADDQRWALESISMAMYPAGRKRLR